MRNLSKARSLLVFIIANYSSLILNTFRGIAVIGLLSPASLGMYRLIFTLTSYFRYYNLGLNSLAYYRSAITRSQDIYTLLLRKTNYFLAFWMSLIFCVTFSVIYWKELWTLQYSDLPFYLFFILFYTQKSETLVTIFKLHLRFNDINKVSLFLALLSLLFVLSLAYKFDLRGAIVGMALATIGSYYYQTSLYDKRDISPITFSIKRYLIIFKSGLLNFLPGLSNVVFTTVEVWICSAIFGLKETGYYSISLTIISFILLFNSSFGVYIFSKYPNKIKNDKRFTLRIAVLSFVATAILSFLIYHVFVVAVERFYPQYNAVVSILKVGLFSVPFITLRILSDFFISQSSYLRIAVPVFLLSFIKVIVLILQRDPYNFYVLNSIINAVYGLMILLLFWSYKLEINEKATPPVEG